MFHHITVLLQEAIEGLRINPKGVYVDCTLGGAGHSRLIASQLDKDGLLIACDQDESAIIHATEVLKPYQNRVKIVRSNFRYLKEILQQEPKAMLNGVPQVDGILFDLGVSSTQLDEAERGFSYHHDAELDMRMNQDSHLTAKVIVNEWSVEQLTQIFFEYGEEKFARRIASNIVASRIKQPIESTMALVEIIKQSIPAAARRSGPHPARRTFQALRIAVNDELTSFEQALEQAIECLAPQGRLAVITFHSLEDRICKHKFQHHLAKCICPPHLPICNCNQPGMLKLVYRKPIEASTLELASNMRARSAKLRIAEKLDLNLGRSHN
jgi:16S rRNA (cytosine1402-N4)-methyltransferase